MKKHNQEFYKTYYADLLDKESDLDLERLVRDLDNLYTATPEPSKELTRFSSTGAFRQRWQREQLSSNSHFTGSHSQKLSAPRLVLAGMAATVLIVMGILLGIALTLGTNRDFTPGGVAIEPPTAIPTAPLLPTPTLVPGSETGSAGTFIQPTIVPTVPRPATACTGEPFTGESILSKCLLDYASSNGLAKDLKLSSTGLVKDPSLTKNTNIVTITLNRVYADTNHILVSYTMSGLWGVEGHLITSESLKITNAQESLSSSQYNELTRTEYWNNGQSSGVVNPSTEVVLSFDASKITRNPQNLKLHFEISNITIQLQPVQVIGLASTYTPDTEGQETILPVPIQSGTPIVVLAQPLVFDFEVPFQPSKVITLNQTVTNGEKKFTLEKVGITPLGARFYLKRTIPNQNGYKDAFSDNKFFNANLSVGQPATGNINIVSQAKTTPDNYTPSQLATLKELEGRIEFEITDFGLNNRSGEWIFSINQFDGWALNIGAKLTGSFTFRFNQP